MLEAAKIGHNKPPSDIEILSERLTVEYVPLIRACEEHVDFAKNVPQHFTKDVEASYTSDYVKRMQVCVKDLEQARKDAKDPFLRQGQFVDGFFGDLKKKLDDTIAIVNKPLQDYLMRKAQEEQKRRLEEDAALQAEKERAMAAVKTAAPEEQKEALDHAITMSNVAEVSASVAAAPVMSMASAQGKYSATNLKKVYQAAVVNRETLDIRKLAQYFTIPELNKALERFVKAGGRQLDGCEIKELTTLKVK